MTNSRIPKDIASMDASMRLWYEEWNQLPQKAISWEKFAQRKIEATYKRQARERQKESGLVRKEILVKPQHWPMINEFINNLLQKENQDICQFGR